MSGPITLGNSSFTSVCSETCSIENTGHEPENLESVLNGFWSAENIEAKDNCVIHDFEKYTFHKGQNYLLDQIINFYRIIFQCVSKDLKN